MREIILVSGGDSVVLRRDITFDISSEEISKSATMASGRLVKDIVGYKDVLEIPVGYLSLNDMAALRRMIIKNNGLVDITYPTPNGDSFGTFLVEPPTYTSFMYDDNGVSVWKGVTIRATAVEVGIQ